MTNTPHLGMPFIEGSQAQKHVTHNEALRILDAAIQIGVLDIDRTAPPSTPAQGDRHIVASGATGAWAAQADAVAVYEDGAWRFLTPKLGWCAWSDADGALLVFDGAAWTEAVSGGGGGMTDSVDLLGINDTASDPNLLSVRSNAALFNAVDVADGGTGDMRVQISKEDSANTASVVFSHAFSGRAEFGLVGSDAFKLKVSNDGTTFVEALAFDQSTGNAAFQRGVAFTGVISPSQITSSQNDYAPTGFSAASTLRLSSDASRNVTGLAGGADGRTIIVHNVGAQNIVLTDQDSASTAANRFLLGGNVTLAANASLSLRYDGTTQRWRAISPTSSSGGGGGGGAAGMTDTERRNFGLGLIYQSKSCAESRRLVNVFATGFKGASDALNGILTGSSSNYVVTSASGYVSPSLTSTLVTVSSQASTSANSTAFTMVDLGLALVPGVTISKVGYSTTAALNGIKIKIVKRNSASNYDVVADTGTLNHPGGGFVDYPLNYTVPGSGSYYMAAFLPGSIPTNGAGFGSSGSRAFLSVIDATGSGVTGWTENTGDTMPLRYHHSATYANMTIVMLPQTTDTTVSNGRVLLEYDNTASPSLNADLIAEISCKLETATVTISNASPGVVTHASHGMSALDPVTFTTSGGLPTGLVAGTTYFIVASGLTSGAYSVSATPGGAAINTSSAGSGTHTATYRNWTAAALSSVTAYSQNGRAVAETNDQACTSGASFAARLKAFNSKNVPVYGLNLTAH